MKRLLTAAITLAVFIVILTLMCTGCVDLQGGTYATMQAGTLPEVTTEEVKQGTFFVRCSEPDDNRFSVQFVGAVPTNRVDYVGFEACIVYEDGTRSTRSTVKLYTLYRAIENEEGDPIITSEDFGIEDGYLFVRALDRIPTDEEGLAYEIASYYVIGNEKYYTAKQTFVIQDLLEEHILSNPEPFTYKEKSEVIEVQNWVKFESQDKNDPNVKSTYYLGASLPDSNGNLKMFACFAVPTLHNNTVGMRYNFTQTSGEYEGVSTSLCRVRTKTLYSTVISETDTLTIEDFGLTEGYLAVIPFSENVNYLTRQGFSLNLELHYSRNAIETSVADESLDFTALMEQSVLTREGVAVLPYTYIPTNYHEWNDFSEEAGNAVGTGKIRIRLTDAGNVLGIYKFNMQLATAIPTRFASRVCYVFTAYDKDGKVVGLPNCEIPDEGVYTSIFDNGDSLLSASYFGEEFERGYIMSIALNNIEYDHEIESIKLEAYYTKNGQKNTVTSLVIQLDTIRKMISVIE